ncbi:MAG: TM0106 family RecB-like putative nuclease [Bacteroidetes bacterium]|nr:TM0106 family RecB-like putative nuclease [Bacteroidota bacterium]
MISNQQPLSASSIYSLFRPSKCDRRVYLDAHGVVGREKSEFEKLIEELGQRHERNHLATFPNHLDLSDGSLEERILKTHEAVSKGVQIIYQGVLRSHLAPGGVEVIGIPDFLIADGETYKIRECKLSRHADEDSHPEILRQVELYGWLFEETFHRKPSCLEVYLGDETLKKLEYTVGSKALETLSHIQRLSSQSEEPYSPVGWSKCSQCQYKDRCWDIAKASQDVATVYELDQSTALALRQSGVLSIGDLLNRFDEHSLSELKKPRGDKMVRVGGSAARILLQAGALKHNQEKLIAPLALPKAANMVMFDLEGLPPQFSELDKVYLWGTQVFGRKPGEFKPALATFGVDGDKEGWCTFLENSESIFKAYGDIPFLHYTHYETTKLHTYINRHGDPNKIAVRVLKNCVDLFKIIKEALVLPEHSYSLKALEKRAGFERTMDEFGGNWSIVQYVRAVETRDENQRKQIMNDILRYNQEDLQATWTVLEWLRKTYRL